MKCLSAILMAATALLFPYGRAVGFAEPDIAPVSTNVNERYRVESVAIRNWRGFLSRSLEREMRRLEGRFFQVESVLALEKRIRYEFPGYTVARRVEKGSRPQQLRVLFDLERQRRTIDLRSPRMLYSSAQNFSFSADANFEAGRASASVGLVTDNDERVERYSGVRGGVLAPLGNGRVRVGLMGESYRAQWDRALTGNDEVYRARSNAEASVVVTAAPGLEVHAGLSLQKLEMQNPAAADRAANALFTTLRYSRQWQHGPAGTKTLVAGYSLRAAANSIGADYSYRRHMGEARFTMTTSDAVDEGASISVSGLVGGLDGRAPLFDRFVLGNSRSLRGWNRLELAPMGGSRVAHWSVDGRYRHLRLCYDSGTIWDEGRPKVIRHSAGVGFTVHGWTAMIAVPLRGGSIEPIFLVGMNF